MHVLDIAADWKASALADYCYYRDGLVDFQYDPKRIPINLR
jgi:hypothetical protein